MKLIDIILLFHQSNQLQITPKELAKLSKKSLIEVLTIIKDNNLPPQCFGKRGQLYTIKIFEHLASVQVRTLRMSHPKWYICKNFNYGTQVELAPLNKEMADIADIEDLYQNCCVGGPGDNGYEKHIINTPENRQKMEKHGWKLWQEPGLTSNEELAEFWKE